MESHEAKMVDEVAAGEMGPKVTGREVEETVIPMN